MQVDAGLAGTPEYQTASSDGSRVFFTESGDLYEFEAGHSLPVALTIGAGIVGLVIGASEDGSYVYFVANRALAAAGAVTGECVAKVETTCDLYVVHSG